MFGGGVYYIEAFSGTFTLRGGLGKLRVTLVKPSMRREATFPQTPRRLTKTTKILSLALRKTKKS